MFQQYAYTLSAFFEGAAHPDQPIDISSNGLLVHRDTAEFLEKAAWDTYRVIAAHNLSKHPPGDRRKALKIFRCLLDKISSFMSVSRLNPSIPANPIHLLYFCAIYIRRLNSLRFHAGPLMDQQAIGMLEETMAIMRTCKINLLDTGGDQTKDVKGWLGGIDRFGSVSRFSPEWWCFLDGKHDEYSKDSEASASHHVKRRPTPAPMFPKPMIPMGGLRVPANSVMLHPPDHVVASDSVNSVYSDESYASTSADSPITNGYSSFASSPKLDENVQPLDLSPIIPHSISSLKKDDRNSAHLHFSSSLPTQHAPRSPLQQGDTPVESTPRNEIEMETLHHALRSGLTSTSRTSPPGARRLSMLQPIQYPEPVHDRNTALSDNPYDSSTQK